MQRTLTFGMEMCLGSVTADDRGVGCNASPPVSFPISQTTSPTQKRQGRISEDKLTSGVSD